MYSQNVYQNQRDLRSSTYIEPVLTSREECEWNALTTFCFLEVIFTRLDRFLSTSVSYCSWIYLEDSPRLSWGISKEFADHRYESFCLSIDSLSCANRSLDLCILFKFIYNFYTSDTFRPLLCLWHILVTPISSYVYYNYHKNIFFLCRWSAPSSEFNFNL